MQCIKKIISEELIEIPNDRLARLFKRINLESGELSDNDSYKVSTRMLRSIYETPKKINAALYGATVSLYLLTTVHHVILWSMGISMIVIPFVLPFKYWCVGLPAMVYIVNLVGTNQGCYFSKKENALRVFLGRKKMRTFIDEYYIKPIKKLFVQKNRVG